MTPQLEKVYFNYILKNKKYFDIVKPYFFRNLEIQFVYNVIQKYMLKKSDVKVPTPRQILDMVSLEDKEGAITKDILKSILKDNLKEYSEKDFIEPKFNTWILANRLKTGAVDIIDETRNLENITDFDKAIEAADKMRNIVDEMTSTKFIQDDDMGLDFDEPEQHVQDSSKYKINCGFSTINHMLGGGWDIQTLNVLMAETSNGKCSHFNSKICIKNKTTGIIDTCKIGDLFTIIKKQTN